MLGLVRRLSRVQSFSKQFYALGLLEYHGGASAAYSLRDLNSEQGDSNVIQARKVVGGSNVTKVFKAKDIHLLEDWAINILDNDFNPTASPIKDAKAQTNISTTDFTTQWATGYRQVDVNASGVDRGSPTIINLIHNDSSNFSLGTYEVTFDVRQNGGVDINSALSGTSQSRIELIARDDDRLLESPDSLNKLRFAVSRGANKFRFTIFDDASISGEPAISLFFHQRAIFDVTISNIQLRHFTNADGEADAHVVTWYDQSGNSNDASQDVVADQPLIVEAGSLLTDSGGRPEIQFNGTSHHFDVEFNDDLNQPNTIVLVHQSDTTTVNKNEFFDREGTSVNPRTLFDQLDTNYRMLAQAIGDTGVAVDTNKNLVVASYSGASSVLTKNGTAGSAFNSGTQGINQNSEIGRSDGSNGNYEGTMQEFIVYSNQQINQTALETDIANYYGITLS
tara:strand:- start:189 stop:1541 length:1353 start_codon:yes stop_codon:yes gene_type:complete